MKRIGIAIVVQDGNVLIGLRPEWTVLAGMHEFPGGKCLEGESSADCAVRECREETGLNVEVVELLRQQQHTYEHGSVDLSFILCRPADTGEPLSPFRWVPVEMLGELSFPEANRDVITLLIERYKKSHPREVGG